MAKIEYYKALKELGAEIPKAKFYDDLGIPVPEKGAETMGWEKGDTPPDGCGTPFGGNTPQGGGKPPAQGQQGGKTAARLQEDLEAAHARSAAGKAAAPCGYFDHRIGPVLPQIKTHSARAKQRV